LSAGAHRCLELMSSEDSREELAQCRVGCPARSR
jgi:hypothetical protein